MNNKNIELVNQFKRFEESYKEISTGCRMIYTKLQEPDVELSEWYESNKDILSNMLNILKVHQEQLYQEFDNEIKQSHLLYFKKYCSSLPTQNKDEYK